MSVIDEIIGRRKHQIRKGYDATHDGDHTEREIAFAAACFAIGSYAYTIKGECLWPWKEQLPSGEPRDQLIDAAALIVAEIERMDRMKGDTK